MIAWNKEEQREEEEEVEFSDCDCCNDCKLVVITFWFCWKCLLSIWHETLVHFLRCCSQQPAAASEQ